MTAALGPAENLDFAAGKGYQWISIAHEKANGDAGAGGAGIGGYLRGCDDARGGEKTGMIASKAA